MHFNLQPHFAENSFSRILILFFSRSSENYDYKPT